MAMITGRVQFDESVSPKKIGKCKELHNLGNGFFSDQNKRVYKEYDLTKLIEAKLKEENDNE